MSGTASPAKTYRLQSALTWRAFDGEWVVCSHATGSLFHLAPLPAALLGLIEGGVVAEPALVDAVAEASGLALAPDLTQSVSQALEQLSAFDLVSAQTT